MEEKNVNKKVKLTTRKNFIISITILLVVMFLGVNAFAATQGYNNIFFVIKNLFTNDVVAEKDEILLDRDITISYEFISIAESLKVQVNNLKIKDGEAELALQFKQEKENTKVPYKVIVSDITNGENNIVAEQKTEIVELDNSEIFYEEYTEQIKLTNIKNETNNLKLEIQDENKNSIAVLEIKLEEKEIDVISSMATELEKLSETELKEVLANFALLNYYKDNKEFAGNEYTEQQLQNNLKIRIAHKLIQNIEDVKHANSGGFQFSIEKTNKVIQEFTGEKIDADKVLDFSENAPYFYNKQEKCYEYYPEGGWPVPLCLEIEELTFEKDVYTATFVYCIPSETDYMDNNIPNIAQYRTTMKFKINEEYTYSKYCLINTNEIESELIKPKTNEQQKNEDVVINTEDIADNSMVTNTSIDINNSQTNNISNNQNVTFSDKEIKETITKYLNIFKGAGSVEEKLQKLGLLEFGQYNNELTVDNYRRTDIKYSEFKSIIMNYMSEDWFNTVNESEEFKEKDGVLYYFDGGWTGTEYVVESINIKGDYSNLNYIANGYSINVDDSKNDENIEFHITNYNGKCVISYCD